MVSFAYKYFECFDTNHIKIGFVVQTDFSRVFTSYLLWKTVLRRTKTCSCLRYWCVRLYFWPDAVRVRRQTRIPAILVFTDWYSHLDTTQKILDAVNAADYADSLVIVCFNCDSENDYNKKYGSFVDVSVDVWKKDHQYVTPFMKQVSQLLEKPNVQIVVSMGNYELAINWRDDTTSENLAEYISKFKEHTVPVYKLSYLYS